MKEKKSKSTDVYTILVVEDDEAVNHLIQEKLKRAGFRTDYALNGSDGIAKVLEKPNIVLLLDYLLPDMTGEELVKALVNQKRIVPFIVMTGHGDEKIAVEMMKLGARDYLIKEFGYLEPLPHVVKRVLDTLVTEKKLAEAEKELRESEIRYRTLFENAPLGISLSTQDGQILAYNDTTQKMTGYSDVELKQISLSDLYWNPEDRAILLNLLQTAGFVRDFEVQLKHKDGSPFSASLSITPLTLSGKHALLTIVQDITDRKKAEDALREAYKELKELDQMKTNFLTVSYHKMRSPLAPIVGYASLLEQNEQLSEKQKKYVRIIGESAAQLAEIIDQMLEQTRVEAGKIDLTLEPISLIEIVNTVIKRVRPQLDGEKKTISTVVPEDLEVEGDRHKITAIFDNLIANAVKYTEEGDRIKIVIEDRADRGEIRVCVADNGIGIPEASLPKIFERFYLVDTSLTRKGGLGLGLSIASGYVKLHGGKIWVTSKFGNGSMFCFTLPKKQS